MSDDDDDRGEEKFKPSEEFSALRQRLLEIERKARHKLRASKFADAEQEKCSFCGKGKIDVDKLLKSRTGAIICSECIQTYKSELDNGNE